MKADLHVHSTASDGTCTPEQLVALAQDAGLTHLSVTDHDSVEGLSPARAAAERLGITLIPGVELSASSPDGRDVHVLGYWIDAEDQTLLGHLASLREARLRRAEQMVASLSSAGFAIDMDQVLAYSAGGAVGRSHIARALYSSGYAASIPEAFERHIGRGRPHYVCKPPQSTDAAIAIIKSAGGLAVVAHPAVNGLHEEVRRLAGRGLSGVEAFHADHTPEQCAAYAALARECGLLTTGGSDFHGPDAPNAPLGSVELPGAALEEFVRAGLDTSRVRLHRP